MKKSIEHELHAENLAMEEEDYRQAKREDLRESAITWLTPIAAGSIAVYAALAWI